MDKAWDRCCLKNLVWIESAHGLESAFYDGWIDYAADHGFLPPPVWPVGA